jgi:hypothetical protein
MRIKRLSLASAALALTFGCSDPFPPGVTQLHACIRGAEFSAREDDGTATECAIPADWELIAIPAGDLQASHLVTIGVDGELADMLVAGDERDSRWCIARRTPFDASKDGSQTTAESSCTDSDAVITEPAYSQADRVKLIIGRGSDGRPILISMNTK